MAQLSDAAEKLEALSIRKPAMPTGAFDMLAPLCRCVYSRVICSTAKLLQQNRSPSASSGGSGSVLGGKGGGMASRAPSKGGLARSPSASATGPPPYSSGAGAASAAATSKRTPPPPPNKPKPGAASGKSYVVALYDYTATVSCHFLSSCLPPTDCADRFARPMVTYLSAPGIVSRWSRGPRAPRTGGRESSTVYKEYFPGEHPISHQSVEWTD